jgi:carboxymethylenebutenolidase
MCYDDNARPPVPPGANGGARGEDLVLTAADGNRFAAYAAHPEHPTGAQVVIFPDVRGLHQFYKDLALRFAETGIIAVAIDYFGRTAGLTSRDESFEYMPHVQQIQQQSFFADVDATLAYLRTGDGSNRPTFTVGFCMGGTFSFIAGTNPHFGLAGIIGFYAGMTRNLGGQGTLLDRADKLTCPALGLFGEADQSIPVSNVHKLDEILDDAGVEHEIIIYPGAPHSFFDRRQADFAEASADAWKRVLAFINAHTPITHTPVSE